MNNKDRKQLKDALESLKTMSPILLGIHQVAKERETLANIIKQLEPLDELLDEKAEKEREYYDERSDSWKQTFRGEVQDQLANSLERALSALQECKSYLEDIVTGSDY